MAKRPAAAVSALGGCRAAGLRLPLRASDLRLDGPIPALLVANLPWGGGNEPLSLLLASLLGLQALLRPPVLRHGPKAEALVLLWLLLIYLYQGICCRDGFAS